MADYDNGNLVAQPGVTLAPALIIALSGDGEAVARAGSGVSSLDVV
jgi:hypothetical protein